MPIVASTVNALYSLIEGFAPYRLYVVPRREDYELEGDVPQPGLYGRARLAARSVPGHTDVPTVLIFGDSLSAGYGIEVDQSWTALLQSRLSEEGYEHRVINASISGETTEGGATRIGPAVERFSPALVVLELGGNDGLRGFPPRRLKENLALMVRTAKEAGAAVVLLGPCKSVHKSGLNYFKHAVVILRKPV